MADNDLAFDLKTAAHEAEFTVAVRRLIRVHEIHINPVPWDVAVKLGMKMQKRLLQGSKSSNPHFCRAECMHPCHDASTVFIRIRLTHQSKNRIGILQHILEDDAV